MVPRQGEALEVHVTNYEEDILRSLRRITRAIDLYSRQLAARYGLTGPQLVCMRALEALGPSTPSTLARHVDLSQATMTGILDRLEQNGLVRRERNQDDRRRVTVSLTESGAGLLGRAPSALQETFVKRLAELPDYEQQLMKATLEKVVVMMGAEGLDAAPILVHGPMDPDLDLSQVEGAGESPEI